jgi:hypothetical protein
MRVWKKGVALEFSKSIKNVTITSRDLHSARVFGVGGKNKEISCKKKKKKTVQPIIVMNKKLIVKRSEVFHNKMKQHIKCPQDLNQINFILILNLTKTRNLADKSTGKNPSCSFLQKWFFFFSLESISTYVPSNKKMSIIYKRRSLVIV